MLVSQNKTRRNYKDSVFVDLFAHDITAKENFISLYNALQGTNLDATTTEVKPVMISALQYLSAETNASQGLERSVPWPHVLKNFFTWSITTMWLC